MEPTNIATLLHKSDPRSYESPKVHLVAGELDVHAMIEDYKDSRHTQLLAAKNHGFATFTHTFSPLSPPPDQPRPRTRFVAYTQVAQRSTLASPEGSAPLKLTLNVPVAHRAMAQSHSWHTFANTRATGRNSHSDTNNGVTSLNTPASPETPRQWLLTTRQPLTAAQQQAINRALAPFSLGDYVPDNSYIVAAPYAVIARVLPAHQRDGAPSHGPAHDEAGKAELEGLVLLVTEMHPALKLSPTLQALREAHAATVAAHGSASTSGRGMTTMSTSTLTQSPFAASDDAAPTTASVSAARAPRSMSLLVALTHPPHLDRTERRAQAMATAHQVLNDLRATVAARAVQSASGAGAFNTLGARESSFARVLPADVDVLEYVSVSVADRDGAALTVHVHALEGDNRGAHTLSAPADSKDLVSAARAERLLGARAWEVVKVFAEHPLVAWAERRAVHRSMNKHSSIVVQGARGPAEQHPMWERGLLGRGQIVAVADTGVDHDNCFFYDPEVEVPFNTFNPKHRKIVAYHTSEQITPRDMVGGDQVDGHGTHTGGTVAGQPYEGHEGEKVRIHIYFIVF